MYFTKLNVSLNITLILVLSFIKYLICINLINKKINEMNDDNIKFVLSIIILITINEIIYKRKL